MIVKVISSALSGISAYLINVEVDISLGLPATSIVGLPDKAVDESKERVKTAIKNSGFAFPQKKIVINLSPADTKKEGPSFDLPIAMGILASSEQVSNEELHKFLIVGELSLDGTVKPVNGILCHAIAAKENNIEYMIVPEDNLEESSVVNGLKIFPVKNLKEAAEIVSNKSAFIPVEKSSVSFENEKTLYHLDFDDVKGQESARRAMEVAAAGNHNILLVGPPGSGKTMIARRIPSILPPLSLGEALEVTKIYSITGLLPSKKGLITTRPFRSPHHSISHAGLVGGSSNPRPGEISLSHHGVLFLDELLEFKRDVIEVLRQPLEDRMITISRALTSITYPANFMLVTALNPCPCGHRGDTLKACVCSHSQIERYWNKLSGPLLDRIDLHLEVPRLSNDDLLYNRPTESSEKIRERVVKAREIQQKRFEEAHIFSNSQMQPKHIKKYCKLDDVSIDLLKRAINQLSLSARAHDRILKVARTIADLDSSENIKPQHIAEAIQYRSLDRARF